jgi:serine/threonine protein kinase
VHDTVTQSIIKQLHLALDDSMEDITPLGAGGFGHIFKAFNKGLGKAVAIKVLSPDIALSEVGLARFITEAKVLSKLSHENIVKIYRFGQLANGAPYITMEFLEGESFLSRISRSGPFSLEQAKPLFLAIFDAVAQLHSQGILHRDISANNCMIVEKDGFTTAKLLDLGLVKGLTASLSGQKLTQTMEICGSLPYLSPEACMGQKLDERTDIYALTCLLYQMLTGKAPFTGTDAQSVMLAHVHDQHTPVHLGQEEQTFNRELEDLISKGLAKTPSARFRTVTDLADEFARLRTGVLVKDRKAAAVAAFDMLRKNPRRSIKVAAFLCTCIGLIAFVQFIQSQFNRQSVLDLPVLSGDQKELENAPAEERLILRGRIRDALNAAKNDKSAYTKQMNGLRALISIYEEEHQFPHSSQCLAEAFRITRNSGKLYNNDLQRVVDAYIDASLSAGFFLTGLDTISYFIEDARGTLDTAALDHIKLRTCEISNDLGSFGLAHEVESRLRSSELTKMDRERLLAVTASTDLHMGKIASARVCMLSFPSESAYLRTIAPIGLRVEMACNDWGLADQFIITGHLRKPLKYECSTAGPAEGPLFFGVQVLHHAHAKEWDAAHAAYDIYCHHLETFPEKYFSLFADSDFYHYAQMLDAAGRHEESQAVREKSRAARKAYDLSQKQHLIENRAEPLVPLNKAE